MTYFLPAKAVEATSRTAATINNIFFIGKLLLEVLFKREL
jgi:hypothetical protein